MGAQSHLVVHCSNLYIMKNNSKHIVILLSLIAVSKICSAQSTDFTATKLKYQSFTYSSFQPEIKLSLLNNTTYRHGAIWYHATSFKNEHVISAVQSNNIFDDVYYLNSKGDLQYRSIAVTAPMNRLVDSQRYDSFNPTGATSLGEGIAQGLMNMLFNQF